MEYVYKARAIEKVTDGDTFWLHLDVGFRQMQLTHIRLYGYDTPERRGGSDFEKAEAQRATEVTAKWLIDALTARDLWVKTMPDPDNFGRWLADLWTTTDDEVGQLHLGEHLRAHRLAVVWPSRWHEEFDATVLGFPAGPAGRGLRHLFAARAARRRR